MFVYAVGEGVNFERTFPHFLIKFSLIQIFELDFHFRMEQRPTRT